MSSDFSDLISSKTIATRVQLRVILHKGLAFRNEPESYLSPDKDVMTKELGNVTAETEITFEYQLKPLKDLLKYEEIDMSEVKQFPFQAQIRYLTLDKAKCIRVITQVLDLSHDKKELEQKADYNVINKNVVIQSSKMAEKGNYRAAQANAMVWKKKMKSNINNLDEGQQEEYRNMKSNFGQAYGMIQQQHVQESYNPSMGMKQNDQFASEMMQFKTRASKKMRK